MTDQSMKTPRARVEGLGAAKAGTEHFWHQRLSGLANAFLTLYLICFAIRAIGLPFADLVVLIASPLDTTLLILTLISFGYHMKLGFQVVIEDYVHGTVRMVALIANVFVATLVSLLGIVSVLLIGFGS